MTDYTMTLFIHEADIKATNVFKKDNLVWCVISIDGSDTPISTSAAPISTHITFNYTLNMQFNVADPKKCYLYITLCCFGETRSEMLPLARAKSCVSRLPLNGPKAFRIPLISKKQNNSHFASVLISGAIDPPSSERQQVSHTFTEVSDGSSD